MTRSSTTASPPVAPQPDRRRRIGRESGIALCAALTLALLAPAAAVAMPIVAAAVTAPADVAASDASGVTIPNLDDVRGNITLPATGSGGSSLTWTTSNSVVISTDGLVERPAQGSDPVTVTLQVTATFGDATATHDYVATVTPSPLDEPLAAYFFPHFVGESTPDGEEIYFAASVGNDPEEWIGLNDGESVLASTLGEQGLRDPFLIRSPEGDRFFLLATDLRIYGGGDFGTAQETGSRSIMVWESDDLVNWSEQREIVVSPENAGNTWAPEAYWDEANEEYIVYWASALYPEDLPADQRDIATSYQRMMYATTRDFVTFSEPQVWIDEPQGAGRGMIDSTVALDGGVYYRFTKDESDFTVREEQSTELRRTQGVVDGDGWQLVAERIGVGQPNPWGGTFTNGEGPSVFKSNTDDTWYLLQDQPSYHGGEGYMLFESADLASGAWTAVPDAELPESPRHGTVLPVTASEYQRLLETYQPDALVEGVTVTPATATLSPGETAAFEASVTPVTAEDRSVTWSSSDESVATVDAAGVVTAVADGAATITARSVSGAEGTATITVQTVAAPELPAEAWVDEFDGATLDGRWAIEGEAPDAWSLTENPGALTVHSQSGDTYQATNTAKNVFLVDVPAGDFTAFTSVTGAVSRDFQGAGLFVMKDFDNYVRAGLTNVSFAPGGPTVIENGVEQGAVYGSTFTARPGSTHEYLRVQRTGDVVVTSYWTGHEWAEAARATVGFDAARIGLYALAAGAAPSHEVTFDYFALVAPEGADIVPEGMFTFEGSGDTRHLTAGDGGALRLDGTRPLEQLALMATEVDGDAGGEASAARPVVIRDSASDRPLVVDGDLLALGADGAEATAFRLTDVGGGKAALHTVDGRFIVLGDGGALVVGDEAEAARLTIVPVEVTEHTIEIDTDAPRTAMSDDLYGIFYEDINYAADGGIYAELVRNRSFEFNTADNRAFTGLTAWEKVERGATGSIAVGSDRARWLNDANRVSLTIQANGAGVGVRNIGFNRGFALEEGESYDFSVWARSATAQQLTVAVENTTGTEQFALGTVDVAGDDTWRKVEVRLTSNATTDAGRLVLLGGAAGSLQLDMVSLFPVDTWVGPVNGPSVLRKDLAEKVAELDPSFLRFPGGCVTNVGTFNTYLESDGQDRRRTYQWKETIGPVEERPTNWNFWGYNQSYGLGYLEYLKWAEDLGATPLPVVSVGANGCGSTIPEMTDQVRIDRWVQDTLDLIEFAKGDVTTEWGAKRAELGHPEPFDLRYIGLGNEENTDTFQANFPHFRDAIEAAWPEVTIISNSGPDDTGARFDELWQFNREQGVDMVDEHYYNDPQWFLQNSERYDSYDREGPHVFLGEYASRGNTFANALSEAAYMTGLERNSDLVELASYAPMFANEDHVQWAPDMMWFDNDESWGSVNYYTQQMFMTNVGDEVVPSTHTEADAASDLDGGVFLSTWNTGAAYDDVVVTDNASGATLYTESFDGADDPWSPVAGSWAVTGGEYVQSSTTTTDARSLAPDAYAKDWSNYTLELDARKTSGAEGFLIGFAAGGPNDFYWWNLGGWNNTRSVLQHAAGGSAGEVAALEGRGVETGRDYHVKIVVDGSTIELYLDGVLQLSYTEPSAHGLYQVVTRDAETGELRLKVVNPTGSTARTQVSVAGDLEIADEVAVTEMVGAPGDMNTKADPENLVPVEREWSGGGNEFSYDFPAYSITFLSLSETPHPSCEVTYTLEGDSKKAFSADLTITNTGDAPYMAWELGFDFAEKQTVRSGHDAWWQQDGTAVTANNLPWNGTIQPGETVELGFNGRLNGGGNSEPAAFSVNGDACTVK